MAFGNMAKAASLKAKAEAVACEMTRQTRYTITADLVRKVDSEPRMDMYVAQKGDVTVLCWVHLDGTCSVKSVIW